MTDYLMHYGVKGMKWGIRKDQHSLPYYGVHAARKIKQRTAGNRIKNNSGSTINRIRNNRGEITNRIRNYSGSRTSNALKEYRKKDINEMSDKELRDSINRMNLERQYRSLTKLDVGFGKSQVNALLDYDASYKRITKSAAYELGKKALAGGVR